MEEYELIEGEKIENKYWSAKFPRNRRKNITAFLLPKRTR